MTSTQTQLARFRALLSKEGLKLTSQRKVIADVFFTGAKHQSLLELLEQAKVKQKSIGYATVYRTMRLLTEGGLAVEHKFGENQARYEPVHDGEHHDHLICLDCGAIVEFEDPMIEQRQDRMAADRGFEVVSHRHEVYVRCLPGQCRRDAAAS
ncbi:MAG: transcriptional repressor [Alphaproteobacteria bacterium]|nr:transcriptional repressor [Alphaproteobacteria bacterium]